MPPAPPGPPDWETRDKAALLRSALWTHAMYFGKQLATWALSRHEIIKVIDAKALIVEKPPPNPLRVVPETPPPPPRENPLQQAVASALTEKLKESFGGKLEITSEPVDRAALVDEMLREGPNGIDLDVKASIHDDPPRRIILTILPGDLDETGEGMPLIVGSNYGWQAPLFAAQERKEGATELELNARLFMLSVPVYCWHGTGLLDVEEAGHIDDKDDPVLALANALGFGKETPEARRRRIKENKKLAESRAERDRERRADAERRRQLMGDPMLTSKQLDELHLYTDLEHGKAVSLSFQYWGKRLWDRPFEELVEQLPPELVALALFGWRGTRSEADAVRFCAWRIRRLDAGHRPAAVLCLKVTAIIFIPADQVKAILKEIQLEG